MYVGCISGSVICMRIVELLQVVGCVDELLLYVDQLIWTAVDNMNMIKLT